MNQSQRRDSSRRYETRRWGHDALAQPVHRPLTRACHLTAGTLLDTLVIGVRSVRGPGANSPGLRHVHPETRPGRGAQGPHDSPTRPCRPPSTDLRGSERDGWGVMPDPRYGYEHQQLRAAWSPRVARGEVTCWRCGRRIVPGQRWDLGHRDGSTTQYAGPEHVACNRGAAGRLSQERQRSRRLRTSEDW